MQTPVLVLKFGTASITDATGQPDTVAIADIARQVAALRAQYNVVIVSSGAVGAGRAAIAGFRGELTQRKAAAAVGNPRLLALYARHFAEYDVPVAQSLCERHHFANRDQFLQLQQTYQELWANGIVPIANENDVVSDRELKFSDNDELATLLAVGFGAERLLLCTSVGGLLDPDGTLIRHVPRLSEAVFNVVRPDKSALGLGGMASKLTFAKLATRLGINTIMFGLTGSDAIGQAVRGEVGTWFEAQPVALTARNRWLASGSLAVGRVVVDAGAAQALRRRSSLLAVGVQSVPAEFLKGEVIEIADDAGNVVAVARARLSSYDVAAAQGQPNVEVANASDIVLL